ncbi:MAG: hypothetical protein V1753_06105 [Pseudomonadota bacterium]
MSIFEVIMLICFGLAWPSSIYTSYKSRATKGKSIFFLYIVLAGYVSGSLHKLFYDIDWVLSLYIINGSMVMADIFLYYRNRRIEVTIQVDRLKVEGFSGKSGF